MFYYPNPLAGFGATGGLTGPPGPTRIPSLELPFSPAQPCKLKFACLNNVFEKHFEISNNVTTEFIINVTK